MPLLSECHRSKGYKVQSDGSADENSSLTGQAVVRLQAALPKARVVYASATGVTDIANMAYFTRLGLWGAGSGFADFPTFEKSVKQRGIGAFELLSMEMKNQGAPGGRARRRGAAVCSCRASFVHLVDSCSNSCSPVVLSSPNPTGMYVSRGLSYSTCEYIYVDAALDDEQTRIYNEVAHFWLDLKVAYAQAMSLTDSPGLAWKAFWGAHLRFFGQLCTSVKVNAIVEETRKAIAEGFAVVIGLQSTGESSMAHETAKDATQVNPKKKPRVHLQDEEFDLMEEDEWAPPAASTIQPPPTPPTANVKVEWKGKDEPGDRMSDVDDFNASKSASEMDAHGHHREFKSPSSSRLKSEAQSVSGSPAAPAVARSSGAAAGAAGGDRAEFPSLYRESLRRFILTQFPTKPYVKKESKGRAKKGNSKGASGAADGGGVFGGATAAAASSSSLAHQVDDTSRPSTPNSVMEIDGPHGGSEYFPPANGGFGAMHMPPRDPSVAIPACLQLRQSFLDRLSGLTLPTSPLDELIDKLGGAGVVAEMTGRRTRYIRDARDRIVFDQRVGKSTRSDDITTDVNIHERNQFMSGEKLIAIISDAASTGISLHADRAVKNQRKRMHLTLELPWSADKACQQLGRTHRSNEVCGVLYALVLSPLGGERRFASACASRLQSLGALTKGDRRAATGSNLAQYDIDTDYGRKALRKMLQHIYAATTPLEDEALQMLQAAGQNALPDENTLAEYRQLDAELQADPPDPSQCLAHLTYLPHPEPWNVHNTGHDQSEPALKAPPAAQRVFWLVCLQVEVGSG